MIILDDILLFPIWSVNWIFREIYKASQEEFVNESERITTELSELYMMLETGKITEAEFESREKELLDMLDKLEYQEIRIEDNNEDESNDLKKNTFIEVANKV